MDIYHILSSKPHNPHHLNRYITFIKKCQQKNVGYEGSVEKHHICPKANDMFPEYVCFKTHPWNCAALTPRQHFIAHIILWKCFSDTVSCSKALWFMSNGNWKRYSNYSKRYEILREEHIEIHRRTAMVRDKEGNIFKVSIDDPRYLSGELVHIIQGMRCLKDKEGNNVRVSVNDPRYISGELTGVNSGKVTVKNKDGNVFTVPVDDPRYLSGELVHIAKGTLPVKDKDGNVFTVPVDDPRYLSGELVHVTKGKVAVRDKDGNTFSVSKDDPRYLSRELVGISAGRKWYNNGIKNRRFIQGTEPEGYTLGKIPGSNCPGSKGKRWYNNGVKNGKFFPGTESEGYVPGKTKNR